MRFVLGLSLLFAVATISNAATIATEDFGTEVQNPADSPTTTTSLAWNYSGPGGANSSRLFNPGANGSATGSVGWITIVNDSAITATIPLSSLAGDQFLADGGGNLFDANVYSLSFVHAAETSNDTRESIFGVDVSSSGAIAFLSGGNGDSSQSFSALADGGSNAGGSLGVTPERTWTMNFSGAGLTTSDTITVALSRTGEVNNPFTIFDDVVLTAVPEPTGLALIGMMGTGLMFLRRRWA